MHFGDPDLYFGCLDSILGVDFCIFGFIVKIILFLVVFVVVGVVVCVGVDLCCIC